MKPTPEQREAIEDVLATMRYRISQLSPDDGLRLWLVEVAALLSAPGPPPTGRHLCLAPSADDLEAS